MAYLTTTGSGQPVLILKEGTTRSRGKEAQRNNIMAARVIGEVLKTTLGPRGMDKMLIDSLGDITITNDGAAILNEIDVEHPAAKMMVEIARPKTTWSATEQQPQWSSQANCSRKPKNFSTRTFTQQSLSAATEKPQKAIEAIGKIAVPSTLTTAKHS